MIRGEATLSAIISPCFLAAQVMAITIDGEMSDWKGAAVYETPHQAVEYAGMPFGAVERLQVTHDEQFLYFRIRFARARLFADEARSRWTADDYPSADAWFLYDVASGEVIEPAGKQRPPQVRMRRADMPPRTDADLDDRRGHDRARRSGACCAAYAPADRPSPGGAEDDHTRAGDLDT